MQFNALADICGKTVFCSALYKIADHIAHQNFTVTKRQICVRQKIHSSKITMACLESPLLSSVLRTNFCVLTILQPGVKMFNSDV